ncbi:tail-specific protease prc [Alcanivorax sp. S71-1-4]|uniref:carboxy terminal-processing peptidase n=1 Tax=Alcanivorax sp. S71-1-4 TaxID=1177159 RepID=UPI001356E4F5|nr:carboxy terminal-processing peptidase [Alcanivorax sp. S71-1-4]KAF0810487.1 tail-specific protease prc [Alcanivorax sp. S71-1-4]
MTRRTTLLRNLSIVALLIAALLQVCGALTVSPRPEPVSAGGLAPEEVHAGAARGIVDRLQGHYRQMRFDDSLSEKVFNRYLRDLDPNRVYFLASDVAAFDRYRLLLDDQLRRGDLSAGFDIFNLYQQRVSERLEYLLARLDEGLDSLSFEGNDSVLLDRSEQPWASSEEDMDDIWERRLKNAVLTMRLDGVKDEEILTRLERRYSSQLNRVKQNASEDVFQIYINALTQTFDPHTSYFTPHTSENFNISMSRSLEGIGAVLQAEDEYTKVVRLVPGGPAAKAGQLKPADRIVGVGQEDEEMVNVIGWRLDEVVNLIRGPKGTEVRLEIIPAGSASEHSTREITIERNKVMLEEQAAKKQIIDIPGTNDSVERIGVIRIPAFYLDFDAYNRGEPDYTSTTRDVARLLQELNDEEPAIDGLVIDLRNNGGGSLHEATQLVSLFIGGGPTVQVRDARGRVQVERDKVPGTLYAGPMAVLVNRFSASASEIFAGAMQDYGRAIIIGDHTFGKGTVQTLLPLGHGQLKLTQAKFYRVSGSSNQNLGIVPDIEMPYLIDKEDIGESALPNALPWDKIDATAYTPQFNLSPYLPSLRELHDQRLAVNPEFIYVREQLALLEEQRQKESVSLNEKERRSEQDAFEARRLAIENTRRKAVGEEPLKDMAALRALDEQRSLDPENEMGDSDKPDPYLQETGAVLADLVRLLQNRQVANSEGAVLQE